ncbi:MAG: hypothetical protein IKM00_00550 [Clostridia bacterium]|nr:hypothetical protein [Clostridia bacterium]
MNTELWWRLFPCAFGIAVLYFIILLGICRTARAELLRRGAVWENGVIRIVAEAESLEYDLRAALAASSFARVRIIVSIPKDDAMEDEMKDTVRMMRRRHKNIFYVTEHCSK